MLFYVCKGSKHLNMMMCRLSISFLLFVNFNEIRKEKMAIYQLINCQVKSNHLLFRFICLLDILMEKYHEPYGSDERTMSGQRNHNGVLSPVLTDQSGEASAQHVPYGVL